MISRRCPSGSSKYTPRPPSLWLISPGSAARRVGPVLEPALADAAEDGVEVVFADQERIVLRGDLAVGLVEVERDAVVELDDEERPEPGRCAAGRGSRRETSPTSAGRGTRRWCG